MDSASGVLQAAGITRDLETCLLGHLTAWAELLKHSYMPSMSVNEVLNGQVSLTGDSYLTGQSKKMIPKTILAKHYRTNGIHHANKYI